MVSILRNDRYLGSRIYGAAIDCGRCCGRRQDISGSRLKSIHGKVEPGRKRGVRFIGVLPLGEFWKEDVRSS
jgi:hypothetical protein